MRFVWNASAVDHRVGAYAGGRASARVPRARELSIHPLTPARWPDLEALFGPSGAYSNCWCMFWRLTRAQFDEQPGAQKKAALRRIVDAGQPPGLIAYRDGAPVAWVAVQPRSAYPGLDRSPKLKPIDDAPVWSITCFFVKKDERRTGLMAALIGAAAAHAKAHGAPALEAYPTTAPAHGGRLDGSDGYMGLVPAFERAGFREVARPGPKRRIMRRAL